MLSCRNTANLSSVSGQLSLICLLTAAASLSSLISPNSVCSGGEWAGEYSCMSNCYPSLSKSCTEGSRPTANLLARLWHPIAATWHGFVCDYRANRDWPAPYAEVDRATVPAPFARMVLEGWQRQNTLSDPHFINQGDQLSETGKQKIREILAYQPVERRVIFVHAAHPDVAKRRMLAVQTYLQTLPVTEPSPPVALTETPPIWSSGKELDQVHHKYLEAAPTPRLPAYQPLQVSSP